MAEDAAVRRSLCLALALFGCGEPSFPRTVPIPTAKLDVPTPASFEGLEHSTVSVGDTGVDAELFLADLTHVRLVALDARTGDRTAARVTTLREEHDAWLVVNGTFFSHSGEPMGLLRQGDVELNPLRSADWGVFEVDGSGHARLVHTWLADDLGCRDALLLDGGPSTQLSARVGPLSMDVHGGWGVPNGIGIVPREVQHD